MATAEMIVSPKESCVLFELTFGWQDSRVSSLNTYSSRALAWRWNGRSPDGGGRSMSFNIHIQVLFAYIIDSNYFIDLKNPRGLEAVKTWSKPGQGSQCGRWRNTTRIWSPSLVAMVVCMFVHVSKSAMAHAGC